jgi:hypothetical protein
MLYNNFLPTENINPVNTCPDFLITEEEVNDQLDILNCTKPSGPDGVAPMILRHVISCLLVLKPVFWSICEFSFIMNTISFTNSFSCGAVHNMLIIRSNNYYFGGDN